MKKIISVALSVLLIFALCSVAFAADANTSKALSFNADGKFKILQVNDTQDIDKMNKKTEQFLKKAVAQESPDLIVVPGDILSDMFPGANEKRIKATLRDLCTIFNDAKVPFAITFGNHDHDLEDKVSIADMMAVAKEFEYCVSNEGGNDPGTYNIPIYSSNDNSKIALNVYMMDTNNKSGVVSGYEGVHADQVEWYKTKSAELTAQNGGVPVPSIVYQHVPVKEIYQFIDEVSAKESNVATFSLDNGKWYKLNEEKLLSTDNVLGEAPCSEPITFTTGQYEAWLEMGDVFAGFFAHDHVNNFYGKTDEGIYLGYNGGTGFRSYGNADKRTMRVFEFNENDVENFETHSIYYRDVVGEKFSFYISDILSPAIVGNILRVFFKLIFVTPW